MPYRIIIIATLLLVPAAVFALAEPLGRDDVIGAYRQYREVVTPAIQVPTVLAVPFNDAFLEREGFAVLDLTTQSFEPHYYRKTSRSEPIRLMAEAAVVGRDEYVTGAANMTDKDQNSYASFPLAANDPEQARITLTGAIPIVSSALTLLLDDHVALPTAIEIKAGEPGAETVVVARRMLGSYTVRFPETSARRWVITLTYAQPLRITELRLDQDNSTTRTERTVRFLAQPGHAYRIHFDPDRFVSAPVGESGNLALDRDVIAAVGGPAMPNPAYTIADIDADGIPDIRDNCVDKSNADQVDLNRNGRGDVCDDFDRDGRMNDRDNCPDRPNANQRDEDGDGIGDVCDNEESRITERQPWLPWAGIAFACLVLVTLLAVTAKQMKNGPPPLNKK